MRRVITILTFALLGTIVAQGQIKIGGNVYGGGNQGVVNGSTKVTVKSGDIGAILDPAAVRPLEDPKGKVFGGARMANVGGNTFVHIDGKSDPAAANTNYILINQVFGGNDIAGNVGTAAAVGEEIPAELEEVGTTEKKNNVDATFNSYVRVSTKVTDEHYSEGEIAAAANDPEAEAYGKTTDDLKPAPDARKVYIGQLFAGGNGDYDYEQVPGPTEGKVTHYIYDKKDKNHQNPVAQLVTDEGEVGFQFPELDKTYLEIKGGSIVYGYGGGNNSTIKETNIIHYDNPSAVVNHIKVDANGLLAENGTDLLTTERFKEMGINTTFSQPSSGAYQVGRFFGGNNLAEMHIRPTWNLLSGKIRNLYSGGNRGSMTNPDGLLLEIMGYSTLIVDNLYGGCRMADVMPTVNGVYVPCSNLPGYKFPNELSARTLVRGGHINNVYGGNDVTGTVYGGNAVGIYATVYGDVYGGGNGNYPYTDSEGMADDDTYGDFYYETSGTTSTEALSAFRPNAEQVSLRLLGTKAKPTVIQGSVFVGGNCASLDVKKKNPRIELKMGSYVTVENVFLGNNGAGMINPDYLAKYAETDFSSLNLKDASVFSDYMEGVAMTQKPSLVFDNVVNGDPATYVENSSFVGSFFCGGNVGSMAIPGKQSFTIDHNLVIYDKFVGGCNNADVEEIWTGPDKTGTQLCAAYKGGVIGSKDERDSYTDEGGKIKDRLEINLANMTLVPLQWNNPEVKDFLLWNKNKWGYVAVEAGTKLTEGGIYYKSSTGAEEFTATGTETATGENYFEQGFVPVRPGPGYDNPNLRLLGANAYGGCYESGHVNGNVVININDDVVKKDEVFGNGINFIGRPKSNIDFEGQRDDLMALSMSVFGAGYGENTEVWGNTTVNLNNGYAFQIYGGGEKGVVGKPRDVLDEHGEVIREEYYFDPAFSSTVNLNGATAVYSNDEAPEDLAEAEYLYGGGNEGDVCGNTYVNLGNGRIYDAFGGASDADILGHTEVVIGRQPNGSGAYKSGFPWVQDIVYGGNDFGGTIHGAYEDGFDATARVQNYATVKEQLHGYDEGKHDYLLKGSSYVEYLQGRVDTIFGGSYGFYDYADIAYYGVGNKMPRQESAFVNLRPVSNDRNSIVGVFGAGTGYPGARDDDKAQDHSYVLVDIPHENGEGFKNLEVFGSGSNNGLGMREDVFVPGFDLDKASAVVDLLHGEIGNAYGGSYREGNTARTVVNVPEKSTIKIKNIFGGAYGLRILPPCDVIQTNVNYRNTSENAVVTGALYGGNNSQRRSIFTNVNISSPVWSDKSKGYLATVYGAGKGFNSWSEHTHIEMLSGAKVYEVYGGGELGHVLNPETVQQYMQNEKGKPSVQICEEAPWNDKSRWEGDVVGGELKSEYKAEWDSAWIDAWSLGRYYTPKTKSPSTDFKNYFERFAALRSTSLVRKAEIDERDYSAYSEEEKAKRQFIYNTNVIVNEGAEVVNYAYGGGLGTSDVALSGDVWGSTYIALLGGKVRKDVYAACTSGAVSDGFARSGPYNASTNPYGFTATTTAYIKGGSCRNVYGGGWEGNVGVHNGKISASPATDIPGETYVVIGDLNGSSFTDGIPTVQRNVYGGGEGGAVYGTANVKLNKGYIGYEYKAGEYVEKVEDETKETPNTLLVEAGNLFGGGYIDHSTVDKTNVTLNGGVVRNSVFGGGEIAAIGRGEMDGDVLKGLYRPGKTMVEMYKGHVHRNVYGAGRGYDNLGRIGSLNCAGYVFGQTEVHVHGGEIGTDAGLAKGDGNVFGGGDIGHVYSAYENADGSFGKGVKVGKRYESEGEGYYYKHAWADDGDFTLKNGEREYTEDCKVLIEPMCQAKLPVSIDGTAYAPGDFVPIKKLDKLRDKNTDAYLWSFLDDTGITIHNAVFAGGNNPPGASATSANTPSVFGNATASVHDVFHRDLITLGTGHTGGLYGDGNLTLVDGYRELNITDYGTDYYSIAKEITIDQYHALPEREAAYYELRYTCLTDCKDKEGTQYHKAVGDSKASTLTADELQTLFLKKEGDSYVSVKDGGVDILQYNDITLEWEPNPTYWEESGVLPVYAGRLMNSIQRADFCGVFGSRMVMQGAQDRVPEEADYTNYTINRVREVSLNKHKSVAGDDVTHGNYFGIYNIVNYLGALTSDKDFGDDGTRVDARTTDNADAATYKVPANGQAYGVASFYDWKKEFHLDRKRNNGSSHNKVALASGVYLEITTEKSTGTGLYEKDWGPITGVVELDLINVSPGIGGGFVYAQNIHGKRRLSGKKNTTLTDLNDGAITKKKFLYDDNGSASKDYTYDDVDHEYKTQWQSSGNFVHSTQTIIDDCYNISNRYLTGYKGEKGVPAHYWYIKGTTYVYDQYISAYTGSSNAYSEAVDIPLTIAAASHGKMKLLDVKPNRYAYYSAPGVKLESGKKMVINDKTYYANDPISYWDWFLLSKAEKELFIEQTYTNCVPVCIDGGTLHEAGTLVMTDTEYADYGTHTYTDAEGNVILDGDKEEAGKEYIFRESNNASHDTGYLLTYEVNNPSQWDTWYTPKETSYTGKIDKATYEDPETVKSNYEDGPTYRLKEDIEGGTVLGQQTYAVGDLIPQNIETTYQAIVTAGKQPSSGQATFEPAYIVTKKITVVESGVEHNYYPGTTVSKTFADEHSSTAVAYICTKTVKLSADDLILKDSKMTQSEWEALYDSYKGGDDDQKKIAAELLANVVPAYYCTEPGLYGGNYYQAGYNYRGLEAWSAMSKNDRQQFTFNYDALDLLIDPSYSKEGDQSEGKKYQYDSAAGNIDGANANKAHYSLEQGIDYTATYDGKDDDLTETGAGENNGKKYMTSTVVSGGKIYVGDELTREQYEALPNEQRHYAPIAVKSGIDTYYVVNTSFQVGATPYAVGEVISSDTYNSLPDQSKVTTLKFATKPDEDKTIYYCREDYTPTVSTNIITDITGAGTGDAGSKGTLISSEQYNPLPNQQKGFTIHGISPTETSTLFVARESNIYDLSKEKIITVVYQYDYEETDASGNVTPVSERHVLNIHLQFKSGVPVVENILPPDLILPGWLNTMREPEVTPGAYEVTGGGWELFENKTDAERHTNGMEYDPATNPLYWYQNGYYVAYYAKTYLGRTYSNAVPVSVANYHDLKAVMDDKAHHYYVDIPEAHRLRDPKIYINDYSASSKNGLDIFKQLFDLSLLHTGEPDDAYKVTTDENGIITAGDFEGHHTINNQVKGGKMLEFFLRTDIDHSPYPWTPIASGSDPCFSGNFHGDGHTISGIAPATGTTGSLFHKLCGNVYNLGVMGSFTGAGIADMGDGYVESCWIKTTAATTELSPKPYPIFGAPSDNKGYQVVNSYYFDGNKDIYNTTDGDPEIDYENHSKGVVTRKSAQAFYNGELAYDLNNFYLYKRYIDRQGLSSGVSYDYFTIGEDNKPVLHMDQYYPLNTNAKYCSTGTGTASENTKYVEDRFKDGDFRYAAGDIPESIDERHWFEIVSEVGEPEEKIDRFSPIYPDDYIFFGQKLTYGWAAEAHQDVPTAVARAEGRLSPNDDANRVYRAPAYFRSKQMGVAHFNPAAYLAQNSFDGTKEAYPGMTAIDFNGHQEGHATSAYKLGLNGGWFYSPLLDDDGLTSIRNCDETQNLLVYAPAAAGDGYVNSQTHGVLTAYFVDPVYESHYSDPSGYRLVSENVDLINGHLVQSDLIATNDHLLVDKQDFNAPRAYTFDASHLMWYQRKPGLKEYVDLKNGWQGISLPFTAELVTTDTKGEITHFYSGSETSKNGTGTKIGHEYWLREFKAIKEEGTPLVAKADFLYPAAAGATKTVGNTFLWDYYYQNTDKHNRKDANDDTYQKYYSSSRSYSAYPLLTAGTPYILGLPGQTYYEFDLSGKFEAQHTALPAPPMLPKQVITFASEKGVAIGVSDDEIKAKSREISYGTHKYTFKPSYMNMALENGDYVMNSDGNAYVKLDNSGTGKYITTGRTYPNKDAYDAAVTAAGALYTDVDGTTEATWTNPQTTYYTRVRQITEDDEHNVTSSQIAFRPYFISATITSSGSTKMSPANEIIFTGDYDGLIDEEPISVDDGTLEIYTREHNVVTTSHLKNPVTVTVVSVAGITYAHYVLQPGETVETPVRPGVYIVNRKKLLVKPGHRRFN